MWNSNDCDRGEWTQKSPLVSSFNANSWGCCFVLVNWSFPEIWHFCDYNTKHTFSPSNPNRCATSFLSPCTCWDAKDGNQWIERNVSVSGISNMQLSSTPICPPPSQSQVRGRRNEGYVVKLEKPQWAVECTPAQNVHSTHWKPDWMRTPI